MFCQNRGSGEMFISGLQPDKKTLLPHIWDKSVNFCDTTQIDIPYGNVHSLTRTIIRAPMDNGWGPVSPYWKFLPRSKLPSEAHSLTASRSHPTAGNSL